MNYYLVDYENVNVSGLDGVTKLTENDHIIIFYSENADTLTFGMHRRINESKANFSFNKVSVKEKNALDFQLCTYLGFLIRDKMNEENNYYIVSNDKGYFVLKDYCKKFGVDLKIVSNLSKNEIKNDSTNQNSQLNLINQNNNANELEIILSKILNNKDNIKDAIKIINNAKTKVEVNNNLCKKFNSQKGGEIYRTIKSFIKDKQSS